MFNDLFSPLMFTIVKLKRRLAITMSVPYDIGSCPYCTIVDLETASNLSHMTNTSHDNASIDQELSTPSSDQHH